MLDDADVHGVAELLVDRLVGRARLPRSRRTGSPCSLAASRGVSRRQSGARDLRAEHAGLGDRDERWQVGRRLHTDAGRTHVRDEPLEVSAGLRRLRLAGLPLELPARWREVVDRLVERAPTASSATRRSQAGGPCRRPRSCGGSRPSSRACRRRSSGTRRKASTQIGKPGSIVVVDHLDEVLPGVEPGRFFRADAVLVEVDVRRRGSAMFHRSGSQPCGGLSDDERRRPLRSSTASAGSGAVGEDEDTVSDLRCATIAWAQAGAVT